MRRFFWPARAVRSRLVCQEAQTIPYCLEVVLVPTHGVFHLSTSSKQSPVVGVDKLASILPEMASADALSLSNLMTRTIEEHMFVAVVFEPHFRCVDQLAFILLIELSS